MGSVAKRGKLANISVDVKAVGIVESAFVSVGRSEHEEQGASRRHGLAVVLDIFVHVTGDVRSRRLVAQ